MYPKSALTKSVFFITLVLLICSFSGGRAQALSKREHLVYFPNTAYELNVYKILGKKPGKTLMLIGGIQGNEPGGFLSADLYADMRLERGNLIVVPRANFYSIILNKSGPHGDMNRKFTPDNGTDSMEDKIVTILKGLISESDFLLNLHDGSGYYYPKYINKWRNPMRFGQSIIADCAEYTVPGTNRTIKLQEMAENVLEEVNEHIDHDLYKFHFMNTKTSEKTSSHKEQRMSATYYALTKHHIPAFGVETSKFLPSMDLKVRYHNLVINAFKELFGIIPESPGLILDPPLLQYLVVSVNGQTPIVVKPDKSLEVAKGDGINVTHIESNYERGLSLDILGYGHLNDYRKDFKIHRNTTMIVRKDNHTFAEIPIKVNRKKKEKTRLASRPQGIDGFLIETNGYRILVSKGETLRVVKGDRIKIINIVPAQPEPSDITVNFKGFVGDWKNNTGEDRGYWIDTSTKLIKRYSFGKKGKSYEIIASQGKKVLGRMVVALTAPKMDYMVLRVNGHKHLYVKPEDTVSLSSKDTISLETIHTNLHSKKGIHLSLNGHKMKTGEVKEIKALCPTSIDLNHRVDVKKGKLLLGKIFIKMN